jgi:branched-chain amino acid transport system ATP-binding protein
VSASLLSVERLDVTYGPAVALRGVDLEVPAGSALSVLGANGAGKSTLARAVSGLVPPAGGRIHFDGVDVTGWASHRLRRAGMVHLPEGRSIFAGLTVNDNLRMGIDLVGRSERGAALERTFELFPVLADRRNQRAGSLSGGEQQMLALARALVVPPKMVIADEPSLGLAPLVVDLVFGCLEQAKAEGVTVILIEQFVHRALAFADYCVILRRGSVAWEGAASSAAAATLEHYIGEQESELATGVEAGREPLSPPASATPSPPEQQ